jgi:membrane protein implicated in regulation of membrane protease activity
MEPEFTLALILLIAGILMLVAELTTPGSFMIVPGTVLIVLGGIGMIYPDWLFSWWSPVLAIVILVPMTYFTIKMYQKLAPPAPPETIVATSLVGKEGIVEAEVLPNSLKGKVRIEHDTWSATSDKVIPVGKRVKVRSSEGVHVKVEELP